jgi:acyl-coenzyme A synthetase/AMP-(fatty) acid ligase
MSERIWRATDYAVLAQRYGPRVAVATAGEEITYRALYRKAAALGTGLIDADIRPGEPVATFLRNSIAAVWSSIGVVLTGAAEVALNPGLNEADCGHCIRLAQVKHVVTTAERAAFFGSLGTRVHLVEDVGERDLEPERFPRVAPEEWAKIGFTSGTTGAPKGIVTSQRGRANGNLLQRAAIPHRPGPASRLLLMTPFSHGASLLTYAYLDLGGSVMLLDGVDTDLVLGILERQEVDEMFAPPTVLTKIVAAAEGRTLSGLKTIYCGTAVLSPSLYARARRIFGPVIRVTYGKTEVINPITVLEADETDRWYRAGGPEADACVGWPATGVEVAIDGAAAPGDVGEVKLRASQMLCGTIRAGGYEPLEPEEFHETGDLGYLDREGRLHLVGRAADVIKTGGYKVAPEEVERALTLSGVEIAVVGLPSEYWGEVIVAVAENPPAGWDAELRKTAGTMTGYKRPRVFLALDELPRNAMLKISRKAVRERVLAQYRLVDGPRPAVERREG